MGPSGKSAVVGALLSAIIGSGGASAAEAPYTPAAGTPERTAILDAMRKVDADPNRVFVVKQLSVADGWAWVVGDPQSRDSANHYETESALRQRSGTGWRVVDRPCSEKGCDTGREMARLHRAHPQAPAAIFGR